MRFQDRFGGDVNMLLFCAWLGKQGIAVDKRLIDELLKLTREWRLEIIQGIRQVRRALAVQGCEKLYAEVKALELSAERALHDALFAWYSRKSPAKKQLSLAGENVLAYANTFCDAGNCLKNLLSQLSVDAKSPCKY